MRVPPSLWSWFERDTEWRMRQRPVTITEFAIVVGAGVAVSLLPVSEDVHLELLAVIALAYLWYRLRYGTRGESASAEAEDRRVGDLLRQWDRARKRGSAELPQLERALDQAFTAQAARDYDHAVKDPVAARTLLADTERGLEIAERQLAKARERAARDRASLHDTEHLEQSVTHLRGEIQRLQRLVADHDGAA